LAEATATVRKRAVSAKKAATPARTPRKPAARPPLEDETPVTNYALRLTEGSAEDDDVWVAPVRPRAAAVAEASAAESSFEARMSEALRAISAAQGDTAPQPKPKSSIASWFKSLDKMPPIRLPIGPLVPWRVGLPAMIALIAVMFFVARPDTSRADGQGTKLPAQETYAVQQKAPLFNAARAESPATDAAPADPSADAPSPAAAPLPTTAVPAKPQPIGVPESAGASFDFLDVGFKLVAVLALAYGSLVLLKRAGLGNGASAAGTPQQSMKVVSSLALAPNRSVHVIRVPGGRTLLVGATPNAVNLLADLGELAEDATPEASSFLDALKGKLG
jgi:flagellar biogenesis protein FliO